MTFDLDAEQRAFADQVERLFELGGGDAARRRAMTDPALVPTLQSPSLWKALAAQGVLGINVPAALGGGASSARDAALRTHIVMHAIGRHLALAPFVSSAVVGASLIAGVAEASLQKLMLPAMLKGRVRLTPAVLETEDPGNLRHVATRATSQPNVWVLEGRKIGILDAPDANWMIVSARTSGGVTDEAGISLFLVSRTALGVQMEYGRGPDGSEIASATLRGVMVATNDLIGTPDQGFAPLERAMQRGIAALCSEAAGAMEKLSAFCNDAADARRLVEEACAAALLAAAAIDNADSAERHRAIGHARTTVHAAARSMATAAAQRLGGTGVETEFTAEDYVRRLNVIAATWTAID